MKTFLSISDVHIKSSTDKNYSKLLIFLKRAESLEVDAIFLLGDIFDLLIGNHQYYVDEYHEFFSIIKGLKTKRVFYFEGNHDFHLELLFKKVAPNVEVVREILELEVAHQKIIFAHGDEFDLENIQYQNYKQWIRSSILKFVANYLIPTSWLLKIGETASEKSRLKNLTIPKDKIQRLKERYLKNICNLYGSSNLNVCAVIFGHSHFKVQENFRSIQLLNNGYFPELSECIYFDGERFQFQKVE